MTIPQEIEYNNRKYICDGNKKEDKEIFSIIENSNIEVPNKFTKYCSLTDYSVESLINNYIYASHPYELNDPLDCYSNLIDTKNHTEQDIVFFEERLKIKINRSELSKTPEKLIDILFLLLFEKSGIISLTDAKNENPSLWANYSNKHSGFSVTYNKESLNGTAIGPFRVDYLETFKKLSFDKEKIQALTLLISTVKSHFWSNEKEWRFIGIGKDQMYIPHLHVGVEKEKKQQNRKLYLPKDSIIEVKLGFYFFDNYTENKYKNNINEVVVDLNKEPNKDLKIKLINFVHSKGIPLSIVMLDKNDLKFISIKIEYEFISDTNTFKYKIPST